MIMKVIHPTDKYKDDQVYSTIVKYCLNPAKAVHHRVSTCNVRVDAIAESMYDMTVYFGKLKGTRIRHTVFSFDPVKESNVTPDIAFLIAEKACSYYGAEYQVFAVVHENKHNPHIHMVMNTVNINDGKKYKGRKADYYAFQNYLRHSIKEYGLYLEVEK